MNPKSTSFHVLRCVDAVLPGCKRSDGTSCPALMAWALRSVLDSLRPAPRLPRPGPAVLVSCAVAAVIIVSVAGAGGTGVVADRDGSLLSTPGQDRSVGRFYDRGPCGVCSSWSRAWGHGRSEVFAAGSLEGAPVGCCPRYCRCIGGINLMAAERTVRSRPGCRW